MPATIIQGRSSPDGSLDSPSQIYPELNLLGLSPTSQVEKHPALLISELCLENLKLCSVFVTKSSDALALLIRTREPVLASFPGARAWSRTERGCRPLGG